MNKIESLDFRDIIYEANIMGDDASLAINRAILDKVNEIIDAVNKLSGLQPKRK